MKARLCYDASMEHLRDTPYELWRGTNGFGDEFELLYYKTDIETYTEIERENDRNANFFQGFAYPEIAEALKILHRPIRFIAVELDTSESVLSVPAPERLEITSQIVEAALRDAQTLISSSGPSNALDRVHTAFHAYLRQICEEGCITVSEDAGITTLFSQIRQNHAKLKIADPQADRMTVQVLRGMAQVIDALNPVRNEKSLAHPNPLLDEPEAMLAINAIRTMLHYLDKRMK